MPLARRLVLVVVAASVPAAFAACESAANLDVTYANVTNDAAADGQEQLGPRCPCDTTLGEGCCVQANALPYCTTSMDQCTKGGGAWMECFGPTTDSDCCWHFGVGGKGSAATYKGECDGGVRVCTVASECGDASTCSTQQCGQLELGACGATKPSCP